MALRIGFDLDGVLADMESELDRQAEVLFGEPTLQRLRQEEEDAGAVVPAAASECTASDELSASETALSFDPPYLRLPLSAWQQGRLWRSVVQINGFWEGLQEIEPGAVARLATLAGRRRWEVIFLTKRPDTAGAPAQVQSQRWLQARGFALPSVFVVQGSRGRIAAALDLNVVVDDRPENCLDVVVESRAGALLVWRGDEKLLPAAVRRLGIGVVKSLHEGLDILVEIDDTAAERCGVIDRVKKLMGFKKERA